MTLVVLAGIGAGVGLVGILAGLRKPRPSLAAVLRATERELEAPAHFGSSGLGVWRVDSLLGVRLATMLESGWSPASTLRGRLDAALEMTGSNLENLCSQAVLGGMVGFFLPFVCWGVVSVGGLQVSVAVPVWAGLLLACAGACLPIAILSSDVKRRRREARRTVGSFLDLVVLCLAGGMGIEGALHSSAQVSDDDVSARLLGALNLARDSGEPPWEALARLGDELGVGELAELAAAVGLAGTQGARIRSTLAAKAVSIRRHELAEAETHANTVTERLFLPGVLLLVGFILFIGYPAVSRISTGL